MAIVIDDLRLAWIWLEAFPASQVGPLPNTIAGGSLGDPGVYKKAFDQAAPPASLTVPWVPNRTHYFWKYYLENITFSSVKAEEAWGKLVPLRQPSGVKFTPKPDWLPGRISLHIYHFPHALGLVASANIDAGPLPLRDAVNKAQEVSKIGLFDVTWPGGKVGRYTLLQLADEAMDRARKDAFGAAARGQRLSEPFSLATVVRGQGVNPTVGITEGTAIHKALDGLCGTSDWANGPGETLANAMLETRRPRPSHDILYARRRGRAVWFPRAFLPRARQSHAMACYHQNLMFASLQTESLLALARLADAHGLGTLWPSMQKVVENAAKILGMLYAGEKLCYRSRSPQRQIDDSGLVATIDKLRNFFGGMAPFHH